MKIKPICMIVFAALCLMSAFFISCREREPAPPRRVVPASTAQKTADTSGRSDANSRSLAFFAGEEDVRRVFTLDYSALKPEPEQPAETLSAADTGGPATDSGTSGSGSGGVMIVPGLRKLENYKTDYFDGPRREERLREIAAKQASIAPANTEDFASDAPLTVVDWGPQGFLSSTIQRPSIYIVFSQPVVPLAALEKQSPESPYVTISPPLKGVFRWYGTGFLSFEAEEPCKPLQLYTISVNPETESLAGNRITGGREFRFETEQLSIRNMVPGESFSKREDYPKFSSSQVPPDAAKEISLYFNYPVTAEDISRYLLIETRAGGSKGFSLAQETEYKLRAEVTGPVEYDSEVTVTLKKGAVSGEGTLGTKLDQVLRFHTLTPFRVETITRQTAYGKYNNIVNIRLSHGVNAATVPGSISTDPPMEITQDNLEINGNTIRLYNLPVTYGMRFSVLAADSVTDVFGRRLSAPFSGAVRIPDEPPPEGAAAFIDSGYRMLEAQFHPRMLFEYKNIREGSWFSLGSTKNPFRNDNPVKTELDPGEKNTRYFEEIDLLPWLNSSGKGFVSFQALLKLPRLNYKSEDFTVYDRENKLSIQVTDLGITVRYGFNKAAVLVTSLSAGEPVEGASVKLLARESAEQYADISGVEPFASGRTDKNGFAVIPLAPGQLRNNINNDRYRQPYVLVETYNGGEISDSAVFSPSSHNPYSFGVYPESPLNAEAAKSVTFMFTDRGLYKPGEVITYRGVDRTLMLGDYSIYQGDYKIALEEDRYKGETIEIQSGTVTESGGFWGSITLPDDLTPGQYRLRYTRGNAAASANIPVTVAYFERLKFQAAVTAPPLPVVSGEDINMTLRASYLSGGTLSGSTYNAYWFREAARYVPGSAETKGYLFGPMNWYDGKTMISSSSGVLAGDGSASLSQKTGGTSIEGAAYRYSVESRVTDISNQEIAASRSVMVHPARFYLGLRRPNTGGFPRSGQEISFEYITVKPDGTKITAGSEQLFRSSGGDAGMMTAELFREEWRRVQQQGAEGYIYDEYVREAVTDSTRKIAIKPGGSFKVKPSKAGYYTLRLTAADAEGRKVLTESSFYVTGSGGSYWNRYNSSEIRLTPDQEVYNPGDTAKILMQSSLPAGWYLITVERDGIYTEEVRRFEEPVSVIDIPIARNYLPVVYVSVSSYSVRTGEPSHTYGTPDLDKPRGYYGAVKLRVNPRGKAFSVKVESGKKTYRPGDEVTMTFTAERNGKPLANAELTLMAVDRGVLDLINYHVPDPISYFYNEGRFPLSVNGGDSRSWLMDPVTYSVKNLSGGDGEEGSKIEERKDFNPTAVFEPMLVTDKNGKVTCTFKLPDSLTTYRVTVFGNCGDLFSLKETEIAAQNRINVREVLPRRLRERDTAEAGVLITNLDSVSRKITVSLGIGEPDQGINNAAGRFKPSGEAFVDGPSEHTVTVKSGENAVVYFDVAGVTEGYVTLNFTINSDILNERLVQELIIEHPYIMETVTAVGTVPAGETSGAEAVVIPSFADNGVGSLSVTLDATMLGMLDSAVTYLFRYPYGCLEQRSSAILPLVLFGEYIDAFGLKTDVADPRTVVESELKEWGKVQLRNGGFPYWPSGTEANVYVSARIAHILAAAKEKGFAVPQSLNIEALCSWLLGKYEEMRKWDTGREDYDSRSYLQSYILYVLALNGRPVDASWLAELAGREKIDAGVLSLAGMTYRAIGRTGEAAAIAGKIRNLLRPTARGVDLTDPMNRSGWYWFYGRPMEQLALTLEFFAHQYPHDDINRRLVFSLLETMRSAGYWENTASTARVLSAIDAYIRAENLTATDVTGTISLSGTELLSAHFTGVAAKPVTRAFEFRETPLSGLDRDAMLPLRVTREGTGAMHYTASLSYAIPSELQSYRDEGLGLHLAVYDIDTGKEIADSALISGKTYRAVVKVSSGRDRTYVALRVPIPSGAEVLNAAFTTTASHQEHSDGAYRWSGISHQEIMDNEVRYFWDRFSKGERTVEFLFRTARRGVYPTPPVQAECMYEPEIFGRTGGALYTIE